MASTTDMAPSRTNSSASPARRASSSRRSRAAARTDDDLSAQVTQLQSDLKQIAATLATLAENKVSDVQKAAQKEAYNLAKTGQNAIEDVQDEFGELEKQLKDSIRQKPLTAVAGAIALGFVLAVVSR
jgi:ElaB/YqjD/DUF883 family membrane-anchored ribosome-binding protein